MERDLLGNRFTRMQAEIVIRMRLPECLARVFSVLQAAGLEPRHLNRLVHRFEFIGRRGRAQVPGKFLLRAYGLGERTRLTVALRPHPLAMLPGFSVEPATHLATLIDLLCHNLPTEEDAA